MIDQAAKLRAQAENRAASNTAPRIIAVTSGKGGVGKTNLVTNLGIRLAMEGKRVLILDADLGMANVDVLLGLVPQYSFYDVLKGEKSLDEVVVPGPAGVRLIPGGSGFNEIAYLSGVHKEQIEKNIADLTNQNDFLLIDTGAGLSRNVLAFVSAASEVMVIVTPEPTSIADAYGLIKVIWRFKLNQRIHLVVNMAADKMEALHTSEKIINVAGHFLGCSINALGYVLDDPSVRQAVREQTPFVLRNPKSAASHQVEAVAQTLMTGEKTESFVRERFVSRIMRLLT